MPIQRIVHFITSLEAGGAQRALLSLLVADCDNARVEHTVLFLHDGPYRQKIAEYGFTVRPVSGFFGVYDPTILLRLTGVLYRLRPHLIHTSLWLAGVLGRIVGNILRVPVLCDLHNHPEHNGRLRIFIDRWTCLGAHFVAVSKKIRAAYGKRLSRNAITVIYNGVDGAAIREQAAAYRLTRSSVGLPEDAFIVAAVGRLVSVKQLSYLLLSHAALKAKDKEKVVTCIVGSGPEREALVAQAAQLGIADDVCFLGHRDDVYGLYSLFDCLVMPSQTEGLSYALLEALACGLSVIVRSDDDHHEVVVDGVNGFIVPKEQGYQGIVHAIYKLMSGELSRAEVKHKNIALIENDFARSVMVTRYHELYTRLGVCCGTW